MGAPAAAARARRLGPPGGLLAALVLLAGLAPASRAVTYAPTVVDGAPGSTTAISGWQIQSSAKAPEDGAQVSAPGYATDGWYATSGRATVMAGLLENGKYPNLFYSDNLRTVEEPDASGTMFVIPWWYRTEFTLAAGAPGTRTQLRLNGLIPGADVWLNGQRIADRSVVAGAYPVHLFDVTRLVHEGRNVLALRVAPGDPRTSLSIGWVDWNPTPPDNNMGPWRGVDLVRTGPVELRDPQVTTALPLPDLTRAALTVTAEVRNLDSEAHEVTVAGTVAGVRLTRTLHLAAGAATTVEFSPATDRGLALSRPRIWWPAGMGEQPLYRLELEARVAGVLSDRAGTDFGIRSVSSHLNAGGDVQFVVNGRPVLIRGAGWASDLFLRDDPARLEAEFRYVVDLGLNALRSEGKLEDERFYALADRHGILVLAGWECCDKWESPAKTGGEPWDEHDRQVAAASMASEARLLRNHPSVIAFLIGSDNAPPPATATLYVEALRAAHWPVPVIAAAVPQSTAQTGPSGMKMEGPYSWVPPGYWYADKLGGAFGFDSEVSAGASIPRLEDLTRMLSPQELEALWKYPELRQYHASAAWSVFATITPFDRALAARYGAPRSLEDFVAKAQLDNYDNARAQFEAFSAHLDAPRPSTGVIYWMLNSAWPSLHWHLYDTFLNPAGAYFGAKLANEPVHIQYAYDTHGVLLVNHTATARQRLRARVRLRALDGRVAFEAERSGLALGANAVAPLLVVPAPAGLAGAYFLELELSGADGRPLSRNVYWLSTQDDVLDWPASNWYLTPVSRYADLTGLASLPPTSTDVRASLGEERGERLVTVTLSVPASAPAVALFQHLAIRVPGRDGPVVPVRWSDNDVTLWPGESLTLTARFAATDGATPVVEAGGWNVPTRTVPVDLPAAPAGR